MMRTLCICAYYSFKLYPHCTERRRDFSAWWRLSFVFLASFSLSLSLSSLQTFHLSFWDWGGCFLSPISHLRFVSPFKEVVLYCDCGTQHYMSVKLVPKIRVFRALFDVLLASKKLFYSGCIKEQTLIDFRPKHWRCYVGNHSQVMLSSAQVQHIGWATNGRSAT